MPQSFVMPYMKARITARDYVCASCWGHLLFEHTGEANGNCQVHCFNRSCEGAGFVTKSFVQRRVEQSHFDYVEAKRNLGSMLGIQEEQDTNQALQELGF